MLNKEIDRKYHREKVSLLLYQIISLPDKRIIV